MTLAPALEAECLIPPIETIRKNTLSDAPFRLPTRPVYTHVVAARTISGRGLNARYGVLKLLQKLGSKQA